MIIFLGELKIMKTIIIEHKIKLNIRFSQPKF